MGIGSATRILYLLGLSLLSTAAILNNENGKVCTVIPRGQNQDDVPNILRAVDECGRVPGGRIIFPSPYVYRINQRMTTHLENSRLEIGGTLLYSNDVSYWVNNSYRVNYQKQSTAWRITGHDYEVDGGQYMGGIDGSGQIWYTWSKGGSNTFGRPMPLHVYNSTNAVLRNMAIRNQQFWAVLVEESSYITLDHFYVNATNHDFKADGDSQWIQNTDGIDTYNSHDVTITNWVYEGGDDAVAFKGNSSNIYVENVRVYGGPGIAFGSLGQYPDRWDILENITVKDVVLQPSFQRGIQSGVYFKSWIGVNKGQPPNGGGGGHGWLRNVTVENIKLIDVEYPIYIDTCLSYLNEDVSEYCDTSTYRFDDIHFRNISGNGLSTPNDYPGKNITFAISLLCSENAPCKGLTFEDVDVQLPESYKGPKVLCSNAQVEGLKCEEFDG